MKIWSSEIDEMIGIGVTVYFVSDKKISKKDNEHQVRIHVWCPYDKTFCGSQHPIHTGGLGPSMVPAVMRPGTQTNTPHTQFQPQHTFVSASMHVYASKPIRALLLALFHRPFQLGTHTT